MNGYYLLRKEFRFEASHQLMIHDGACARLHGHSWVGQLEVRGQSVIKEGPKTNMVIDYAVLGQVCKDLEAALDHRHLNDVLGTDMPTSEFLVRWIANRAGPVLESLEYWLVRVSISETCTTACDYVIQN